MKKGEIEENCYRYYLDVYSDEKYYHSEYDQSSIMHYKLHSSSFIGGVEVPYNRTLSLKDKLEIVKLYPGRILPDVIIDEHEKNKKMVLDILNNDSWGNCTISKNIRKEKRLNSMGKIQTTNITYYLVTSKKMGEYILEESEDAEAVYLEMENGYCNMQDNELGDYIALKKSNAANLEVYGRCAVLLDEYGNPEKSNCPLTHPYRFGDKNKRKPFNRMCYQLINHALLEMKKEPKCLQK